MVVQVASPETCVAISGVGLIGGSIAAAIRVRSPGCHIIGVGRSAARLEEAVRRGLLDEYRSGELSENSLPAHALGIACQPVNQIVPAAEALLRAGCGVVTDAGSVKDPICRVFANQPRFVGAHPIAGSEQNGFEAADSELFAGRVCVITPVDTVTEPSKSEREANSLRVAKFWASLGMRVVEMLPPEHDRILALTSHLPHVLASVAAGCVTPEMLPLTGTGFRDTTRIAAGSAAVWTSILSDNAEHCIDAIQQAESRLAEFRKALQSQNLEALTALWDAGASLRRMLDA